ncbi:hypothetical protein [Nonomuraea sp. B1E8]|uniref:hypothetical protein n=1 Tax=unclassified Nonomuraea TaxID=2593643 RepID=UPI00325E526D
MGRAPDPDGFGYRSGELMTGANSMVDASRVLDEPVSDYTQNALPTSTCFGLVPEGSEELARNYGEFYGGAVDWLGRYKDNLHGSGIGMAETERNYDAADRPCR